MSIFSTIDAERDLKIVEKAIADAKNSIDAYGPSPYPKEEVVHILDRVLQYCRENITE